MRRSTTYRSVLSLWSTIAVALPLVVPFVRPFVVVSPATTMRPPQPTRVVRSRDASRRRRRRRRNDDVRGDTPDPRAARREEDDDVDDAALVVIDPLGDDDDSERGGRPSMTARASLVVFKLFSYCVQFAGGFFFLGLLLNLSGYGYAFERDRGLVIDRISNIRSEVQFEREIEREGRNDYSRGGEGGRHVIAPDDVPGNDVDSSR
jgi:hypothetical protein